MNGTSAGQWVVEGSGDQVAPHVGLALMASFADRIGLGDSVSGAVPWRGERAFAHDRGKVLVHAGLMLAGGGESCADIETLAAGSDRPLLESVCSDTTLWRTLNQDLTPAVVDAVWAAVADVRAKVWARSSATTGTGPVVLDIDASLVEIHSENKEGSAPHYKRGFGFHPMFCFADATGEALAAVLRPGNAAANNIADHETVLDAAIGQLPAEIAAGHRPGDDPALARRQVRVRTDSAGCTRFVWSCRARNIGFSVVARTTAALHAALLKLHVDDDAWTPLIDERTGEPRDDAYVADITGLVDLEGWPPGTKLIVRRERRHPGAQHSLFPSELWRYWGHYTDQTGDPADLDADMRAHAPGASSSEVWNALVRRVPMTLVIQSSLPSRPTRPHSWLNCQTLEPKSCNDAYWRLAPSRTMSSIAPLWSACASPIAGEAYSSMNVAWELVSSTTSV